jgi:hypothetical protein
MEKSLSVARVLGVLLILHLVIGLTAPFIILHSVTGSRGFLTTAVDNAGQIRIAIFLLMIGSAMAIAVSAAAQPLLNRYSPNLAFWLLSLSIAAFTLQAVDCGRILSMLSLSQHYAASGSPNSESFQSLAVVVGTARKWAHYTYLLLAVSWIVLLFAVLFRFRLVPRALAAFGIIASLMQIGGVTVWSMLGHPPETRLAMPLAPAYIALALWLIFKGLREPAPTAS